MFESEKLLSLSDLADIKLLQEFQDTFAKAMNVASITVDNKGAITRPSNFTEFCTKHTRGSSLGQKCCVECDLKWGKIAAERGEPVIYSCHTGLTDFAVPIVVSGKHVGSILGGQVLTEAPDEKKFRKIAKQLAINEDEYIEALRKIKIVPLGNIEAAARLLYLVANAISEIGHKNLELFQKNRREGLYRIIMGTINATSNAHETKKRIVNIIGQTLHADRCFLAEYDKATDKFLAVKDEYLSSDSISSFKGIDLEKEYPEKSAIVKRGKPITFDSKKNVNKEIQKLIEEGPAIKVNISIPLHYGDQMLGALVVHYIERDHSLQQAEINLLNSIAAQISVVIHQEKLYKNLKRTLANQSAILNNLPFMAWLKDTDSRLLAINEPFAKICNTAEANIIGKTDFDLFPKKYAEIYIGEDKKVMEERLPLSGVEPIPDSNGKEIWHETFKSPLFDHKNNVIGTVGLSRDITDKKESELELQRQQEEISKANEREKINRKIIDILRSTLNKDTIKNEFVNNIGNFVKADRVFLAQFDVNSGTCLPVDENSEYLSSDKEKSFVGFDWSVPSVQDFIQPLLAKKEVIIPSLYKYLKKNPMSNDFISLFEDASVKSSYNFPIFYREKLMGFFCIEYTKEVYEASESELNLLRNICFQAGIALYQAELYEKAQNRLSLSESAVFKIIDKIKDPLRNVIKQNEALGDDSELGESLKVLMSIIKDV